MRVCVINKITPRYIRRGPLNFYMSDTGWRTSVPGSVWAPVFDYACRSVGFGIARSFNTCFNIAPPCIQFGILQTRSKT